MFLFFVFPLFVARHLCVCAVLAVRFSVFFYPAGVSCGVFLQGFRGCRAVGVPHGLVWGVGGGVGGGRFFSLFVFWSGGAARGCR